MKVINLSIKKIYKWLEFIQLVSILGFVFFNCFKTIFEEEK